MSLAKGLALTGFMGAGKTTVGKLVADATRTPFVDLDDQVARAAGCPVGQIFEEEGEAGFRQREATVLAEITAGPPVVAALGGGTLHHGHNRSVVLKTFDLVALTASFAELRRRVGDGEGRPLWGQAQALLEQREPGYRQASLVVDTEGRTAQQVAEHIVAWVTCASR